MKIRNFARAAGFAASMALMLGGLAQATETDGNLPVSADISNTCSFGTINDLAFSTYDPVVTNASTDLTTSSTFGLTCTSGASITIGLSLGANAVTTQRYMIDGGTDVLS
jgi:spore coat protein U-like protein